jgi:hypothetical protein
VRSPGEALIHLIGRHKRITQPQYEWGKLNELAQWPLHATLFDGSSQLAADANETSKEKSKDKCIRELLRQLFEADEERFQAHVARGRKA